MGIRTINLGLPVMGRIAIGELVGTAQHPLPKRLDHFLVQRLGKRKGAGAWELDPLHEQLAKASAEADGLVREIPIRFPVNDPDLVLQSAYCAYDTSKARLVCSGNGEKAKRLVNGIATETDCPGPKECAFVADNPGVRCRVQSRAYVILRDHPDQTGCFRATTTSYNSTSRLQSRLHQWRMLFGGLLGLEAVLTVSGQFWRGKGNLQILDARLPDGVSVPQARQEVEQYRARLGVGGVQAQEEYETLLRQQLSEGLRYFSSLDNDQEREDLVSEFYSGNIDGDTPMPEAGDGNGEDPDPKAGGAAEREVALPKSRRNGANRALNQAIAASQNEAGGDASPPPSTQIRMIGELDAPRGSIGEA